MKNIPVSNQPEAEEEIDFLILTKLAWVNRLLILKITGLFVIIGLLIAIFSSEKYTASSSFIPQTEAAAGVGKFGGLASLAGINLSAMGASSEIPPTLYPKIVKGVNFKLALLDTPVTIGRDGTKTTYREYYEKYHSQNLFSSLLTKIINAPRAVFCTLKGTSGKEVAQSSGEPGMVSLSEDDVKLFQLIEEQLWIEPDQKEGVVELRYTMPEALMAAEMAKASEELLQKEVIAYKIQNAREQLIFTQNQFEEKRSEYKKAQQSLGRFRDRNQHVSSAVALNQMQNLEAEYNFAFDVYTELAKQLEQSKLQVSRDTPVFSIINPVSIPFEKSAPKRGIIVVAFGILGVAVAFLYVFSKSYRNKIKNEWRQAEL
ncbi:hypothetical protein [Salinimicrobium sp. TH3]|uniref:hypothetical protein n=1 Tax=Salinimicrobium sp. TH3 TaxID=2997342 RepID=UPI002276BA7D|nr:hypothetical protein [Salinimicrobium sp. TH3]MCY2687768.1 hypothetical protein [Salinimicrobium sp. TH3]